MLRYVPVAIAAVLIVGATVFNGITTERWTGGVSERTLRFAAALDQLPMQIGPWEGTDLEVDEKIQRVAGAVGKLSREYRNVETGEQVGVWLIVGHGSMIVRHTPDVCYRTAGFRPDQGLNHYKMPVEGEEPMTCWTDVFYKSNGMSEAYTRVFWMWYDPRIEGPVKWDAPGHEVKDARYRFGACKSLFKLYLRTQLTKDSSDIQPSEDLANKFAQDFMPALNDLLLKARSGELELPASDEAEAEPAADTVADAG